jgi:hypothetical protein
MKLDVDPFLVSIVNLGEKKILVRTDQAVTTRGKNVVMLDELRSRMMKPRSPEVSVWKENIYHAPKHRVKSTSSMLMDKYVRQQQWDRGLTRLGGIKRKTPSRYYHEAIRGMQGRRGVVRTLLPTPQARTTWRDRYPVLHASPACKMQGNPVVERHGTGITHQHGNGHE